MNHGVLIIETFLIALLARFAYRRREPDIAGTIVDNSALDRDGIQIGVDSECCINSDIECIQKGDDENVPDLGMVCKYSGTDKVAYTVSL